MSRSNQNYPSYRSFTPNPFTSCHRTLLALLVMVVAGACSVMASDPEVLYPRIFTVNYVPRVASEGNQHLFAIYGWRNPVLQNRLYIQDLVGSSHGLVNQRNGHEITIDEYPIKIDGFRYDDASYRLAVQSQNFHQPDGVDYKALIRDHDLARKVDWGVIDEVFMQGAPYFGYWESNMAGRGSYWCNSSPQVRVPCSKIFVVMGFNYERGVAEMLHSCGHRTESIMEETYDFWDITQARHDWERFTQNVGQSPSVACGSVHYPPNGVQDYDYTNATPVTSTAIDWELNFPNLTGQTSTVNRSTWGGVDYHRNFMNWWYRHMPHHPGSNNHDGFQRLNSWWSYNFNFNQYRESGGAHTLGAAAPVADPFTGSVARVTTDAEDDWSPQINDAGRVVWYGFDGQDFEIYSANRDGSDVVQITNNSFMDESPRINNSGQIVWQAFDGMDYEIFTANADGSGLTQITDNTDRNDWHPEINDSGRIVWDGFDGTDYEIFAADVGGGNQVQITNNSNAGYPFEDIWPRINANGRIVWTGYDGSDWEIYSALDDGTALTQLTSNGIDDEFPQINDNDYVVWHSWATNSNTDIWAVPAAGGSATRLTTSFNFLEDWHPQINNQNRVVWMSMKAGNWEILAADVDGGNKQTLTTNATHDQYPVIDDTGRVTWQGFDGSDWEIYQYYDGTIRQLTSNTQDDRAPSVAPLGNLSWHAETGGGPEVANSEIHTASNRLLGDMNCDGVVSVGDINPFVLALTNPTGYADQFPDCDLLNGDTSGDGELSVADINGFVALLTGS